MYAYDKRFADVAYSKRMVGEGWHSLLDFAYAVLARLRKQYPSANITVIQVKEKFGTLCFYWDSPNAPTEALNQLIALEVMVRRMSALACEKCGRYGKLRKHRSSFYLQTLCDEHSTDTDV